MKTASTLLICVWLLVKKRSRVLGVLSVIHVGSVTTCSGKDSCMMVSCWLHCVLFEACRVVHSSYQLKFGRFGDLLTKGEPLYQLGCGPMSTEGVVDILDQSCQVVCRTDPIYKSLLPVTLTLTHSTSQSVLLHVSTVWPSGWLLWYSI